MTKNPARRPVRTIPAWRPSRRQLLRGLAAGVPVAIGLPTLDAMLDGNARAYADGTALPRRFGTWFFAAGVHQGWQPGGGTLELQGPFAPLAAHASSIAMVSGLSCPSFGDPSTNRHIMGAAAQLTGHPPAGGAMTAPSLDQVMADVLDDAPRRAMIVGVTGYGSGESGTGWHAISHSGPNAPNVAQLDPRAVYQDMFAGAQPPPGSFDDGELRLAYLDACRQDIVDLQGRLGAHDRMRLEGYLDGVREIEAKIEAIGTAVACNADGATDGIEDWMVDNAAAALEVNAVMAKLVALGMACGVSRVFSFQFMEQNSFVDFGQLSNNHHELGHQQHPDLLLSVSFIMEAFATLLSALAEYPEGAGTVLDNTGILAMTETSSNHEFENMFTLVAGRAGGGLRGGLHVPSSGPTSRAALTVMRALGAPFDSWGSQDAQTTEVIHELET